jgi:hypothetical protein
MAKKETVNIGNYLLAKDGKTKYLKLEAAPKATDETKKLVKDLIEVLGTDMIYVNLFDADFKSQYKIPDFAKGRIAVEVKPKGQKAEKDQVNF